MLVLVPTKADPTTKEQGANGVRLVGSNGPRTAVNLLEGLPGGLRINRSVPKEQIHARLGDFLEILIGESGCGLKLTLELLHRSVSESLLWCSLALLARWPARLGGAFLQAREPDALSAERFVYLRSGVVQFGAVSSN